MWWLTLCTCMVGDSRGVVDDICIPVVVDSHRGSLHLCGG